MRALLVRRWNSLGLQLRIMTYVAIGLMLIFGTFAFLGSFIKSIHSDLLYDEYKASSKALDSQYTTYQSSQSLGNILRFSGIGVFTAGATLFISGLLVQTHSKVSLVPWVNLDGAGLVLAFPI